MNALWTFIVGATCAAGHARVLAAIEGLLDQTRAIERAVEVMGLEAIAFEGSDSLDAPETIMR